MNVGFEFHSVVTIMHSMLQRYFKIVNLIDSRMQ
jgi:hypothetical protein